MFSEDAVDYIEKYHADENIALMVVTETEVRQVVGNHYPTEDLDKLVELISRLPHGDHDIDHNYWYEQRGIFRLLVETGMKHIANIKIREEVTNRNYLLAKEMGLTNIRICLDKEIRPMMVVNSDDDTTITKFGEPSFILSKGSTFGDLLRIIDAGNKNAGDHIYLEDLDGNKNADGTATIHLVFGS